MWEQMVQMLRWWTSLTPSTVADGFGYLGGAHPPGNPFQEDMDRTPEHPPGAPEDDEPDAHGDDGVQDEPAGKVDDEPAGDDSHRGGGVADDMEKGALDVEVVVGVPVEGGGGQQVHHQADGGDDEHGEAFHLFRMHEPPHRLVDDARRP